MATDTDTEVGDLNELENQSLKENNMKDLNSTLTIMETKKDYFVLSLKGEFLGEFERSELRHIIEQLDSKISF
mgnify:CR=1 FL=1